MSDGIPEGWHESKLDTMCTKITDGSHLSPPTHPFGLPIATVENMHGRHIDIASCRTISNEDFNSLVNNSCAPESDDVLFSKDGTVGKTFVYSQQGKIVLLSSIAIIRTNTNTLSPQFLTQFFQSPFFYREIENSKTGSAIKRVVLRDIKTLNLLLPPIPEQQKIASILTSVDEVIEKTEAQIGKLQDLKKGMMQELLTRGIGHTEFKDSPVGSIPKGWKVLPLGDIARVERGKFSHRPRNDPRFYGGSIPFIQTGDVPKDSPYIAKHSQSLNEDGLAVSRLFAKGTLVITIAATIGEIGMLTFDSCFPDSLVGMTVNPAVAVPGFILYMMRARKDELVAFAPQTAQKNINLETLNPFLLPTPPRDEQETIAKSMFAVDDTITRLQGKLGKTRDGKKALMQDLLTGKVRVKVN